MRKVKGKQCYLCGNIIMTKEEGDRDHVPPRNIFPEKLSGNLITVPTHKACNTTLSKFDETFRAFLTAGCFENEQARSLHQTVVKRSLADPIGQKKRSHLLSKIRNEIVTDNGELIKGPMFLIEEDNPALIPQFKRIIKGVYYDKLKKTLPPCTTIELYFKNINDFTETGFKPKWNEVEKDVFRCFLHTQDGDDAIGIAGLLFFEKLFCLGFFS